MEGEGGFVSIKVSKLNVYPVKSFRAFEPQSWPVDKRGLQGDRRWMVVDAHGKFLTQRGTAKMALCHPRFFGDHWLLSCLGQPDLVLHTPSLEESVMVEVWGSCLKAVPCGSKSDEWVSQALGMPARLVYMPNRSRRLIEFPDGSKGGLTSFVDNHPILVAGEASLEELNTRLEIPVPMDRFRPNIVLTGSKPFEEDSWDRIQIGSVVLRATKPCARCSFTTLDHQTGISQGSEPLRTLATFRRVGNEVRFGMYYLPEILGKIEVGDGVVIK